MRVAMIIDRPTPFVKATSYLILNLRDALKEYVLEKRQMIVSISYT